MLKHHINFITFTLCLLLTPFLASAQLVDEPKDIPAKWSQPYQPFRIAGNLYYVGTADLACYLIATPKGNILINTGLAASLPIIKANVETLGFKFNEIKILLTTQAHYDHMGAMAEIKKVTGAQFMVDEKDAAVAEDGGKSDYALGGHGTMFKPIVVDRLLHHGDLVRLGGMQLEMLHHPGHTKGSCSFLFYVKDGQKKYRILIANMPTIVTDKKFSALTVYPDIEKDYAYTISEMKKLNFDIWLASHASQFELDRKHKPGDVYHPESFIDRKGYDELLNDLENEFLKKK
ncbi:subclass B3 metallo-beta-lactamase [Agrobacterium tumefaciens]|nr:subclass B3 metallo-beta-lactamase [Agrobacterium tumefaciens]NTE22059.1 subclass B3 metallo-beta-lactamase [Agrobacterium tumefaciens]